MSEHNISAANWGLVFYGPNPSVTLNITAGATNYSINDIYGATVSSGSISSSATSFSPTPPSGGFINGWYLVQISGGSGYYAIGSFMVLNNDSRFKSAPAWGSAVSAVDVDSVGDDFIGFGLSQIGAYRDGVFNSTNVSSPSNGISYDQQNLNFSLNWKTADTTRQPVWVTNFPNGAVDAVSIGNIRFTRRGTQTDAATITIGAGSAYGYKLTVTDTATSSVVETHDNCVDEKAIQAAVNANGSGWVYAWGAQSTAPAETTVTLPNSNTLGLIQVVQALYNYNTVGVTWFEGPSNEPSGGDPAGSAAFVSIVHAANASAKALTPSLLGAQNGSMANYVAAMQEIGVAPDGVSFHGYNMFDEGDLDAMEATMPDIVSSIKKAWPSVTIFQTEFGESNGLPGFAISTPGAPTVTPTGTTGTTNYWYEITALTGTGETTPSTATETTTGNASLTATNYNAVSWSAVSRATGYNIYRSTDGSNYYFIGSTASTSFNDTGQAATTQTPATGNDTGVILEPYQAAHQMPGILGYAESIGIPKEQFFWFYPTSHGFNFPSWWKNGDGTFMPNWLAARGLSERLYGRTFKSRASLPFPLNRLLLALQWADATNQCWLYWLPGLSDATLTLSVTGASSLTVHDWAGNQSSVAVANNVATLTINSLGTYVTAPVGATITVTDLNNGLANLGQNLANWQYTGATMTTSSTVGADQTGNPSHPGVQWLTTNQDLMTADRSSVGQRPWVDNSQTFPSYLTTTFDTPTLVDRALMLSNPPFQRSTPVQFEIQYQAPGSGSWTTCYSYNNPKATSSAMVGPWWNIGSTYGPVEYSGWDMAYHFDCSFSTGPVLAQAIRIVVQAASWGNSPTSSAWLNDTAQTMLRYVGLYCYSTRVDPSVLV